ncbi:aminomethyl-transferring glycine dehydrogenase subunit GcvPA [Nevskia ramosa]|uniref:aminomethyl-transferring glycine dehydrogenase subunit GcvPA n=1 Tax=Nevskia ramosa TaxID=64002 RepID=UPI0003B54DB8|nr:aminomethyl-transferring glycine dehydrogenase subunit GcvPA [Nevskia ramosa]
MPFIPHTETDVAEMLAAIGAPSIDSLFGEIPAELRCKGLSQVPERVSEMEIARLMHGRAAQDGTLLNFCGAGAYEHHIPAAVWEIATRGEFYSAYTPYQAEASQGTLQLLYEYQSMMCALTGMEVSNASLYDGASALAEALLMAVRANSANSGGKVLMPQAVHPYYREVVASITDAQGINPQPIGYDPVTGATSLEQLRAHEGQGITAVVIQQPNFFGVLEDVDAITDWAQANGALVVAVVNPVSLGLLQPPGLWGAKGVDIVCGEGQPLGAPLSSGGPYFGFLTARQVFVRQMPGRIVGRTVDLDGKPGYTLTLQAREQHIRRSKATSNICTNQGLLVTAATIHMSLLGPEGLESVAVHSMANTQSLVDALTAIPGVSAAFDGERFHEAVIRLPQAAGQVLAGLAERGIFGGFDLSQHYPALGSALLVCATETRTAEDIARYATALREILAAH